MVARRAGNVMSDRRPVPSPTIASSASGAFQQSVAGQPVHGRDAREASAEFGDMAVTSFVLLEIVDKVLPGAVGASQVPPARAAKPSASATKKTQT